MTKAPLLPLFVPITFEGNVITELEIRRPKVRDLRAIEETDATAASQLDQGAAMLALLAGVPLAAIEELDAADFARASEIIAGFFETVAPRGTGEA